MSEDNQSKEQDNVSEDSGVIKELRQKANSYDKLKSEYEEARTEAAEQLLMQRGYPKMASLFASQVEGFPTAEKAEEFLEGLGLTANEGKTPDPKPEPDPEPDTSASGLGQRVASLASGATPTGADALLQELENAQSRADVRKAMENARASG